MKGDADAAIMSLLNLILANMYTGFWSGVFIMFSVGYALVYFADRVLERHEKKSGPNPSPSPSAKTAARERMDRRNRRG